MPTISTEQPRRVILIGESTPKRINEICKPTRSSANTCHYFEMKFLVWGENILQMIIIITTTTTTTKIIFAIWECEVLYLAKSLCLFSFVLQTCFQFPILLPKRTFCGKLKVMILSNVRLFLPFRVKSSQEKYLHSLFTPKY